MKKLALVTVLSLTIISFGLTGCETIEGAGKDIENAGQSVQNAAD